MLSRLSGRRRAKSAPSRQRRPDFGQRPVGKRTVWGHTGSRSPSVDSQQFAVRGAGSGAAGGAAAPLIPGANPTLAPMPGADAGRRRSGPSVDFERERPDAGEPDDRLDRRLAGLRERGGGSDLPSRPSIAPRDRTPPSWRRFRHRTQPSQTPSAVRKRSPLACLTALQRRKPRLGRHGRTSRRRPRLVDERRKRAGRHRPLRRRQASARRATARRESKHHPGIVRARRKRRANGRSARTVGRRVEAFDAERLYRDPPSRTRAARRRCA